MDFDFTTETITPNSLSTLALSATGAILPPTGTTAQRPSVSAGAIRYNTDTSQTEFYQGGNWVNYLPVVITSPTNGQFVGYNGTNWVNTSIGTAAYSVNVGPSGTISWSNVSGNTYNAIITHNLGTQNVVVQMADISNNQVVQPDLVTINSASQVTVQVNSNTRTLRVVVLANGASIAAGASTPSSVIVQNNGVALSGTYTTINFTGVLSATGAAGVATVSDSQNIIRTLSFFASSLDSPNNADWVINALAPAIADPTNAGLTVRQFSNTTEQGVGCFVPIPSNATNITFAYKGRAQTAPGTTGTLQMRFYARNLANNTATGTWSAANNLTSVGVPTNANWQYYSSTATLASLSLTAGNLYQFEFTRNVAVSGNPAVNWLLVDLEISFT